MPRSIRNPYFRQAVDSSRRLVYEARSEKLLFDVVTAFRDIEEFTGCKAFNDYLENEMLGEER
jgi:hypothetical protein